MGAVDMWAELKTATKTAKFQPYSAHHRAVRRIGVAAGCPPGGVYVDATVGGGGTCRRDARARARGVVVGIDRDPAALAAASERLSRLGDRFVPLRGAFGDLPSF